MPALALSSLGLATVALLVAARLLLVEPDHRLPAGPGLGVVGRERAPRVGHRIGLLRHALGRRLEGHLGPARVAAVARRLVAAGLPGRTALHDHLGRQATLLATTAALGVAVLATGNPAVLVLGPLGAWLAVDGALSRAVRRRTRRIETQLPDHLDVVAVLLSAGLGFREAMARVAEALPGPVADEVDHVLRQLELGVGRRQAFTDLRGRNESEAFDTFVATLLQAEELGSPLSEAMIGLAADLRRGAAQRARRQAAQTAPRVSLVLTTVIVPASMLLLVAGLFVGSGVDVGSLLGS